MRKFELEKLVTIKPWYLIPTIGKKTPKSRKYLLAGSTQTKPILIWAEKLEEVAKTAEMVEGCVYEVDSNNMCEPIYYAGTDDILYQKNTHLLKGTGVTQNDISKARDFVHLLKKWDWSASTLEELFSAY